MSEQDYIWKGVKPSSSSLVTKVFLAMRVGHYKVEHLGCEIPLNHYRVRQAAKDCLKALQNRAKSSSKQAA